jgi:hypothetical protein
MAARGVRHDRVGYVIDVVPRVTGGVGLLAVIAGAVVLALGGSTATVIGGALLGLGCITLVALIFLIVGESEDRDRTRHPRG